LKGFIKTLKKKKISVSKVATEFIMRGLMSLMKKNKYFESNNF